MQIEIHVYIYIYNIHIDKEMIRDIDRDIDFRL